MNWKRFFALLLVLALLPALFGNAFAAGPKARTLTDADYAPIDALWAELDAVEQDAQTQSAQDGPDRTLAAAQAVAEAVMPPTSMWTARCSGAARSSALKRRRA